MILVCLMTPRATAQGGRRDAMVRGFGRRDALGGRRDAARGSGVSLVLLACSQPRIAAQRAVRARRGRVCGLMRAA